MIRHNKHAKVATALAMHPTKMKAEKPGDIAMSQTPAHDFALGQVKKSMVRKALENVKESIEK